MGLSGIQKAALLGAGLTGVGVAWRLAQPSISSRAVPLSEDDGAPLTGRSRIVILGAGFAGVYAARELARLLPRAEDCEITLVDQNNYFLFTPMLTEVVGGEVDTRDIVSAVRLLSPRVTFVQGRVESIDLAGKRVTVRVGETADGIPTIRRDLEADHLVIALGSVTNFHGIKGLREHALTIKNIVEATAIHDRALALLERADAEPDPSTRRELLTFVVGGGGFSGVETMAALNDLVRGSVKHYPNVRPEEIRTVLVHPGERLLPELAEQLATYALHALEQRGVDVILQTKITGAGPDYVEMEQRPRMPARALIWTAGVTPDPLIAQLDCERGKHGGIVVDESLQVPGHPGVWAVGDCAEVPQPGGGKTYAPTAQDATREGKHVAQNILATLRGAEPRPFAYRPIGELAIVGKRTGVASVYGIRLSGLFAWAMWRAIYVLKEPSPVKRARIAATWLLDMAFGRDMTEIAGQPSRNVPDQATAATKARRAG
ncbi:MAG: FAD-dependent oxidoreductase [Ktedonobacterales bacterium]